MSPNILYVDKRPEIFHYSTMARGALCWLVEACSIIFHYVWHCPDGYLPWWRQLLYNTQYYVLIYI